MCKLPFSIWQRHDLLYSKVVYHSQIVLLLAMNMSLRDCDISQLGGVKFSNLKDDGIIH